MYSIVYFIVAVSSLSPHLRDRDDTKSPVSTKNIFLFNILLTQQPISAPGFSVSLARVTSAGAPKALKLAGSGGTQLAQLQLSDAVRAAEDSTLIQTMVSSPTVRAQYSQQLPVGVPLCKCYDTRSSRFLHYDPH